MLSQEDLEAQWQNDLRSSHLNARIYIFAKVYHMLDLEGEALSRCAKTIDNKIVFENAESEFGDAVEECLEQTARNDFGLRPLIYKTCAKYRKLLDEWPRLTNALASAEPMAWMLFQDEAEREQP